MPATIFASVILRFWPAERSNNATKSPLAALVSTGRLKMSSFSRLGTDIDPYGNGVRATAKAGNKLAVLHSDFLLPLPANPQRLRLARDKIPVGCRRPDWPVVKLERPRRRAVVVQHDQLHALVL